MMDGERSHMNRTNRLFYASALLTVFALTLWGCGDEGQFEGEGDLVVYWKVAGGTCTMAGIPNVRVELYDEKEFLYDQVTIPCTNGQVTFGDVESGIYSVQVFGLDLGGDTTYVSPSQEVDVAPGDDPTELTPPLLLEVKRSGLDVFWSFASGKLCNIEGISEIEVAVWDMLAEKNVHHAMTQCTIGHHNIEDITAGQYQVQVFGLDGSGIRVLTGLSVAIDLGPGDLKEVSVVLDSCDKEEGPSCN
jgi:hypothetical protein